ncbi:aminopeptidase P family protein [Taibaiella chishuiensis]|uniref:Xaa-Pro aminopeptidase n=1 Tax=Taibaiella chishuiensis TaxID=1434707 RepID=A0A2P8DD73_9BACT|nr:aminopeptidase P family protein [Taibaiella chishuiensis]PSK95173.1 Xaa-Pro aminopeptidase [Taibaiella chishuiensis]
MKYEPISSKLYTQNRARFAKQMKPNSIAIFVANPVLSENSDAVYAYKANSDVTWLSGVTQEKTMVILYPDNADTSAREVLVVQRPDEMLEKWNGHLLRKDEATAISGIGNIQFVDSIDAQIQLWMHHADHVYLDTNENDRIGGDTFRTDLLFVHTFMKQYPLHRYERAARIMKELRAIKTKEEVEQVQRAVDITHKAFLRVCGFVQPGVMEYEIEAEITHEFIRNRATRHAYGAIIASGDRARTLHYVDNNQECKAGELLLMDFGAEYGNYNADLSRTIPVSGKFTKRQKEVYNACLNVHNYCKSILKPGINYAAYIDMVNKEMEKQLVAIGLISKTDLKNQDPANPAYRKYFYHGIGHHLGLDVHDIGTRNEPVKEGMLFTIEPGIYIEEEQMGIRIENNYWLTKTGSKDLFKGIPITVEEIEAAMKK